MIIHFQSLKHPCHLHYVIYREISKILNNFDVKKTIFSKCLTRKLRLILIQDRTEEGN